MGLAQSVHQILYGSQMVMGLGTLTVLNSASQTLPRALSVQLVNYLEKWSLYPTTKCTGIITLSPGVYIVHSNNLSKEIGDS